MLTASNMQRGALNPSEPCVCVDGLRVNNCEEGHICGRDQHSAQALSAVGSTHLQRP